MHLARTRSLFFMASLICALIIGAVVYLQHNFGLEPCILCHFQRAAIIACAVLTLVAAVHAPGVKGWRRYCVGMLLIILVGATVAGTQIWLQTAPGVDVVPVVALLESGLDVMSLSTGSSGLRGLADICAVVTWSLFGLSLPEWSLLAFVGLALMPVYLLFSDLNPWVSAESRTRY
ncbi:disulfide bond formation protein B [Pseudomonas sp. CDFA 602]|uniref:disulfide bond formation protein B n=1 Tax=Pseudomonas californiensis TaxID=2829823 RepID=UPI001E2DF573|nr:disulfide bond formation protein B [Pseudomonas californiensis]MCD5992167.1 disulfide bond formation protein B [Pseudomonas californiensis]MCD5997775.1 disulfide bond formation protein B [Pseudomonas californiensis]